MITRLTSLVLLPLVLLAVPVKATFAQAGEQITEATSFEFNPPDDGMPGNTTGGASRPTGACLMRQGATQASNITFLAPSTFLGLTASANPQFLLYVDQPLAQRIFISIQNAKGESIFQGFQALPTDSGIVSVSWPDDAPMLEYDETYKVAMVPVCADSLRPDDPALVTYVKRVSLPTSSQYSELEIAQQYAEAGIWYDTLVLLGQALVNEPQDDVLKAAWENLLSAGGFTENISVNGAF